jgi:hypothetical protein
VEAVSIGLANACYADVDFESQVQAFVDSVLANSWFSARANKRLLVETDGLPLKVGLAHET